MRRYLVLYGVTLSSGAAVVVRFTGARAAGNAILCWMARDQAWGEGGKTLALAFAVDWLLIFIIGVSAQLSGAMNALGWSTVVSDTIQIG